MGLYPRLVGGTRKMPPRLHPFLPVTLLQRLYYEEGHSLRDISLHTGTNYRLVRDSFRAHGLKWRSKSEARAGRPWDEATKEKIARSRTGYKDTPEVASRKREILATAGGWGWNKGLTAEKDERVARQRNASRVVMRSPEFRARASERMIKKIQTGTHYIRGYHDSLKTGHIYYMSGWELRRWRELDADPEVLTYQRHPVIIPYTWDGSTHHYIPDVLVSYHTGMQVLEEIKPKKFLTRPHRGLAKLLIKMEAGKQFAVDRGWGWRILEYLDRGGASSIFS